MLQIGGPTKHDRVTLTLQEAKLARAIIRHRCLSKKNRNIANSMEAEKLDIPYETLIRLDRTNSTLLSGIIKRSAQ